MTTSLLTIAAAAVTGARRSTVIWAAALFTLALVTVAVWPSVRDSGALDGFSDALPAEAVAALGMADFATPAGYLMANLYALFLPLLLAVMAIAAVAAGTSGPEEDGRLETLFSLPVSRSAVYLGRFTAVVVALAFTCAVIAGALVLGRVAFDMAIGWDGIVLISVVTFAFAVFHGSVAYLVAGAGGSRGATLGIGLAVLVLGYVVRSLLPLIEGLEEAARFSPWEWMLGGDPLRGEILTWGLPLLLGLTVVLLVLGTIALARRDLRSP